MTLWLDFKPYVTLKLIVKTCHSELGSESKKQQIPKQVRNDIKWDCPFYLYMFRMTLLYQYIPMIFLTSVRIFAETALDLAVPSSSIALTSSK